MFGLESGELRGLCGEDGDLFGLDGLEGGELRGLFLVLLREFLDLLREFLVLCSRIRCSLCELLDGQCLRGNDGNIGNTTGTDDLVSVGIQFPYRESIVSKLRGTVFITLPFPFVFLSIDCQGDVLFHVLGDETETFVFGIDEIEGGGFELLDGIECGHGIGLVFDVFLDASIGCTCNDQTRTIGTNGTVCGIAWHLDLTCVQNTKYRCA